MEKQTGFWVVNVIFGGPIAVKLMRDFKLLGDSGTD
jgi:hypothetical protein